MKVFLAVLAVSVLMLSAGVSAYQFTSPKGYQMEVPDGWEEISDDDPFTTFDATYEVGDDFGYLSVGVPLKLREGETLSSVLYGSEAKKESYYNTVKNAMAMSGFDMAVLREGSKTVNGRDVFEFVYTVEDEEVSMVGKHVLMEADRHVFIFSLTTVSEYLEGHEAEVDSMLESFSTSEIKSTYYYTSLYGGGSSPAVTAWEDPARLAGQVIGVLAVIAVICFLATRFGKKKKRK